MTHKVYLRPDAEMDIKEAANWYEKQLKNLGDEFLDEVLFAFKTISENPFIYPLT